MPLVSDKDATNVESVGVSTDDSEQHDCHGESSKEVNSLACCSGLPQELVINAHFSLFLSIGDHNFDGTDGLFGVAS